MRLINGLIKPDKEEVIIDNKGAGKRLILQVSTPIPTEDDNGGQGGGGSDTPAGDLVPFAVGQDVQGYQFDTSKTPNYGDFEYEDDGYLKMCPLFSDVVFAVEVGDVHGIGCITDEALVVVHAEDDITVTVDGQEFTGHAGWNTEAMTDGKILFDYGTVESADEINSSVSGWNGVWVGAVTSEEGSGKGKFAIGETVSIVGLDTDAISDSEMEEYIATAKGGKEGILLGLEPEGETNDESFVKYDTDMGTVVLRLRTNSESRTTIKFVPSSMTSEAGVHVSGWYELPNEGSPIAIYGTKNYALSMPVQVVAVEDDFAPLNGTLVYPVEQASTFALQRVAEADVAIEVAGKASPKNDMPFIAIGGTNYADRTAISDITSEGIYAFDIEGLYSIKLNIQTNTGAVIFWTIEG